MISRSGSSKFTQYGNLFYQWYNPKLLGTIYGQMTQTSLEFVPAAEPVTKRVMTTGCSAQHTMIAK